MTTATQSGTVRSELDDQIEEIYNQQPEMQLVPASFEGQYSIIRKLGEGAQAEIFRIEDATGERFVLKKTRISYDDLEAEVKAENVSREVKAMKRLNHQAIPQFVRYEVEQNDRWRETVHYVLMEDVDGKPLDEVWKEKGPCSAEELVDYGEQALDALAAAHEEGVIHRDFNPANMLLNKEGELKIIDWGVSKFQAQQTRLGTVGIVGTPGYIAPELMDPESEVGTDKINDIYSLGASLIGLARGEHIELQAGEDGVAVLEDYLAELDLDEEFKARVRGMITRDPLEREKCWKLADGKYEFQGTEVVEVYKEGWETKIWGPMIYLGSFGGGLGYALLAEPATNWVEGLCFLGMGSLSAIIGGTTLGYTGLLIEKGIGTVRSKLKGKSKKLSDKTYFDKLDERDEAHKKKILRLGKKGKWYRNMSDKETLDQMMIWLRSKKGDQDIAKLAADALDHPNQRIRRHAIAKVAYCDLEGEYSSLVAQMAHEDEDEQVRLFALQKLEGMRIDEDTMYKYVRPWLKDGDWWTRAQAAKIIANNTEHLGFAVHHVNGSYVAKLTKDNDVNVRITAMECLCKMNLPSKYYEDYVKPNLGDAKEEIRAKAIDILALKDPNGGYRGRIAVMYESDPSELVKKSAEQYLKMVSGKSMLSVPKKVKE